MRQVKLRKPHLDKTVLGWQDLPWEHSLGEPELLPNKARKPVESFHSLKRDSPQESLLMGAQIVGSGLLESNSKYPVDLAFDINCYLGPVSSTGEHKDGLYTAPATLVFEGVMDCLSQTESLYNSWTCPFVPEIYELCRIDNYSEGEIEYGFKWIVRTDFLELEITTMSGFWLYLREQPIRVKETTITGQWLSHAERGGISFERTIKK